MVKAGRVLDKFIDECKMAVSGVVLATREGWFWLGFVLTMVVFGTLLNLLTNGFASFRLMAVVDWPEKASIVGNALLGVFGKGRSFGDWAFSFLIILLQSMLIGLLVMVAQMKRKNKKEEVKEKIKSIDNVQDAGLTAGLAILGSGCPTCGTTLLAPALSTFIGSGSLALAGFLSWGLTVGAVVLALWTLKRVGREAYVIILDRRYRKKRQEVKNGK